MMFTPQMKTLQALTITPRFERTPNARVRLLNEDNGDMEVDGLMENLDDWRGFKEAGMLDEGALGRRDREAVVARISGLEKELHDYQHTMGLLLIEKKEWTVKCDELSEALSEAQEIFKREQTSHLIAMDEVEKRERNLRKALKVEEERIADLERALRTTCAEYELIKSTSSNKLSEATALETGILERSIEVQDKLCAADAKLAEANRKSLELERRLQEIESRENVLRKERNSFIAERESHDTTLWRHREDLQQWERELQEREESLCDSRRIINLGEEKANMVAQIHKEKDKELKEKQKSIELDRLPLYQKEENLKIRSLELDLQEKNIASLRVKLEEKEKELNSLKERLNSRDQVEIQKVIDEYQRDLDSKKHEFDLEMERKRKKVDDEMRVKVNDLEQMKTEIDHMDDKLQKREQTLVQKIDEFKVKEKEIKSQSQLLKEREKSLKVEKKKLELDKKDMALEKESLEAREVDLEKLLVDISRKQQVNLEESEKLKVAERERAEHLRLQMDLKQEIERVRQQQEVLLNEGEILKQDKRKFEEEWENLDENRAAVDQEMQKLNREKEMFEKIKNDHKQLKHDYDVRKRELEIDMETKQNEMELNMQEREKAFEKEKEAQLSDIEKLKLSVVNEIEEMKSQKLGLQRETEKIASSKRQLEVQQIEMQKDINELFSLSEKVNNQRELLTKERSQFHSLVERLKNCESCAKGVSSYAIHDQNLAEGNEMELSPLPVLGCELRDRVASYAASSKRSTETDQKCMQMEPRSHSRSGILKLVKCASELLKMSPTGKSQHEPIDNQLSEEHETECPDTSLEMKLDNVGEESVKPSFRIVDDSTGTREVRVGGVRAAINDHSHVDSKIEDGKEHSEQSKLRRSRRQSVSKYKKGTQSSKRTVIEDTTSISAGMTKDSHVESEGVLRETKIAEKGKRTRKRNSGQSSQMTPSELQTVDSEHSESVTAGGYRKRRKADKPVPPNSENKRYNLRRKKPVVNTSEADATYNAGNIAEGEVSVGGDPEPNPDHEAASTQLPETAFEDANRAPLVQVTTYKRFETEEVYSHRVLESNGIDEYPDQVKLQKLGSKEDRIGTPVHTVEDEPDSALHADDDGNYHDDSDASGGDDDDDPGEVSVGRKLWTFFTS
ncbi:hypothetical protein Leryth_002160 [Lithospermum erythrorhizon]|nr:hypothetical protein Leryth_002160 [Lithospermum erythrorhizon]